MEMKKRFQYLGVNILYSLRKVNPLAKNCLYIKPGDLSNQGGFRRVVSQAC